MAENTALLKTVTKINNGETVAHIQGRNRYQLSFDFVGSASIEFRLKHPVTGKLLQMINQHCGFITGSYSFSFISLDNAELIISFKGDGIIDNLSVTKG